MKNNFPTGELKNRLAAMHYRAHEFNGRVAQDFTGIKARLEEAVKALDVPADEEKRKEWEKRRAEYCGLIDRARAGNEEARHELNALRSETIDLYVRATSNFTQFFAEETLQQDQQAVFVHTYRNEVRARFIGQDGGLRSTLAVKAQKQVFVDMKELVSDDISYPLRDINLGTHVEAASQATVDISYDVANRIDLDAFTLYSSLLGPFKTTGKSLSNTWIPNSRINQSLLPTTNVWDLSIAPFNVFERVGVTTPELSLFRLAVCRAAMNYCESWGNIFGTPLRPTGVIRIPANEVTGLSVEITPTGATYNQIADRIMMDFTSFDYMGIRWTLVPDVTLLVPGQCFVHLNKPVGKFLTKPSFDEEFVETNKKKNIESRSQMKVYNLYAPEPWRVNAFSVIYHH